MKQSTIQVLVVPISAVPSQTLTSQLGGQNCQINIYQKSTGLYLDLFVNNINIVTGMICQDRNAIVRFPYLGFNGDLYFKDLQGTSDPYYTGLGSQYILGYMQNLI